MGRGMALSLSHIELSELDRLAGDLKRDFGALDIRLFGSAARGDLHVGSDIDLFVVVPDASWEVEQAICDRCYDATLACGRLVSVSVVSSHQLTNTPLRSSTFVRAALSEGQRL